VQGHGRPSDVSALPRNVTNGGHNERDEETVTTNSASLVKDRQTVLLQTAHALAFAKPGGSTVCVRILFDSGSQLSYVTERLRAQLGLKQTRIEKLHLNTFGNGGYKTQSCAVVKLYLRGLDQKEAFSISALTSPAICSPLPSAVKLDNRLQLCDLPLADRCTKPKEEIDILVGSNFYWSIVTGEVIREEDGLVAVNSKLGWLLSGPVDSLDIGDLSHVNVVISGISNSQVSGDRDDVLYKSLREFWELESLSIVDVPVKVSSFVPSISFNDNRYSITLPWKDDHVEIPDHLTLCESRLRGLLHRLRSTPDLLLEYDKIIKDHLECGMVEVVEPDQPSVIHKNVHYLPHHGVIRQASQTTKLRIVYNGSARAFSSESSLNDCLETGPNYIPKLFDILVRFRWHKIAITADIEKAFLMVAVDERDRDFL